MMIAMDMGTATVLAALIAAGPATFALFYRRISQINRAVNHVGKGEPTLIERVKLSEKENKDFREWVVSALTALGEQVGTHLPPPPTKDK